MGRSVFLVACVMIMFAGCADPSLAPVADSDGEAPAPQGSQRGSTGAPERTEGPVEVALEGLQFRASKLVTYRNDVIADLASLSISIGAGDLQVVPGSGSDYTIKIELYGRGATEAEARANLNGLRETHDEAHGLTLETAVTQVSGTNHGANVHATLPRTLYFETMDLGTGSADISLNGFDGAVLKTSSGSGDQSLDKLRFGKLDADAGSGDLAVKRTNTDSLTLDTGSGDIAYSGRVGDVTVSSGSGHQTLDLTATRSAKWSFEAGSGEVTVTASGGAYDVQATNGSGTIDLDFDSADEVGVQDEDHKHVRTRGFATASVKVTITAETGSGDIVAQG